MRIVQLTIDTREHFKDYANPTPYFGTAPQALLDGFSELSEYEVHVVSCVRQPVASPERLAPNIFYHSLVVPKFGWMTTLYQGCIRAVRRKLREIQPDIVHGQGTERDCAICAVHSGFPNVVTIHGNMRQISRQMGARLFSYHGLTARLEGYALRRTSGVFCNSDYTESMVRPLAGQTWKVPNAVSRAFFEPPERPRGGIPTLLNAGTITAHKGQVELLDLAERLFARGLKFRLRFAGAHDPKSSYGIAFDDRLRRVRLIGDVAYLGALDQGGLIIAMDEAAALVHTPSEESFGLVIAEALARDLEIFSFATGGVVQTAAGQSAARFVPTGDWAGMETLLAGWLQANAPRSQSSRVAIRERYYPRNVAGQHVKIYHNLLAGLHSHGPQ